MKEIIPATTVITCDKCNELIPEKKSSYMAFHSIKGFYELDLCEPCTKDLIKWLGK